jgi:tetratricopeptide (TPR) repeat protein
MYRAILSRHPAGARIISSALVRRRPQSQQHYSAVRLLSTCGGGGGSGGDGCGGGGEPKERFPMPDRDEELKLAAIQSTITDHYKRGDFTKALTESQDLLTKTEKHFGRDHPATASAYNNVGLMQKLLGDFIEARKHYQQAMRIYGKVVGRDHASYAMTLHNLGTLNKSQVHFDTSLKATERLSLVETALEYLEEAWAVRKVELGDEHPHTVATRSSFGSTLAAQVLYQHKFVQGSRTNNQQQKQQPGKYVALNPQSVTDSAWQAAEEHLRQAMQTAITNPRGKTIRKTKGSKKKQRAEKNDDGIIYIETLSAAAAAQNLAVFLKSRAMTEDPYNSNMMEEAKTIYARVSKVRAQLLPAQHPDLYATKYSLAELFEAIGDEEAANSLRQEILDTYDPPNQADVVMEQEQEFGPESDKAEEVTSSTAQVVVERTSASASKS